MDNIKYLVFAGEKHYSCGPVADFIKVCDTYTEAEVLSKRILNECYDRLGENVYSKYDLEWVRILDSNGKFIAGFGDEPFGECVGRFNIE